MSLYIDPESLQGYADDLVSTIHDKDHNSIIERAQNQLDYINNWCNSVGLSINCL